MFSVDKATLRPVTTVMEEETSVFTIRPETGATKSVAQRHACL